LSNEASLCSCIYCREVKSSKGIFTHVDRAHLHLTKYSSGHNGKYDLISDKRQARILDYTNSPNKCAHCNTELKYDKRHNKFCSTSCAAIYNNAAKDYSKFKTGPAKSKQIIKKQCKHCTKEFDTYSKKKQFCNLTCAREFKNIPLRANRTAWKNYRADCQFRFGLKEYPDEFNFELIEQYGWYKASNYGNNLTGVSRDHMVSCRFGFENNLPYEHIRHPANCKLMVHNENVSKNKKNSIEYEELLKRISEWDNKYSTKKYSEQD
jgi:hypothetical protein